jgi:hypothetical protein
MEYRIFERSVIVGWTQPGGLFCVHWYIGKWRLGADLGSRPVMIVDYDVFQDKVEIITIDSYKHKHGE